MAKDDISKMGYYCMKNRIVSRESVRVEVINPLKSAKAPINTIRNIMLNCGDLDAQNLADLC